MLQKKLYNLFILRFNDSALLENAKASFSYDILQELPAISSNTYDEYLTNKLQNVINQITGPKKDYYNLENCYPGYKLYIIFMKNSYKPQAVQPLETLWEAFWQQHHNVDAVNAFIHLFQFVQCKTFSEAICETVGSIMNIHRSRGRNLHPVNYGKELF